MPGSAALVTFLTRVPPNWYVLSTWCCPSLSLSPSDGNAPSRVFFLYRTCSSDSSLQQLTHFIPFLLSEPAPFPTLALPPLTSLTGQNTIFLYTLSPCPPRDECHNCHSLRTLGVPKLPPQTWEGRGSSIGMHCGKKTKEWLHQWCPHLWFRYKICSSPQEKDKEIDKIKTDKLDFTAIDFC